MASSSPPLDLMIGQMLLAGFRDYSVDETSPIVKDIRDRHLGGVILYDYDMVLDQPQRNIKDPEQVKALIQSLQSYAQVPLFIGVDQEGGNVQRLKPEYGFTGTPSAQVLGTLNDTEIQAAATITGQTLKSVGFNLNFAPVVDVLHLDSPAIGKRGRSFSSGPERIGHCARLFLEVFNEQAIIGCLKHFPGHGSATEDSHYGWTDVTQTWSEAELIPYRKLVASGLVDMVMTAHTFNAQLDPVYPATLSKAVITDILRKQIGFNGVVITDDMSMQAITDVYGQTKAIRLAIEAGVDILLIGNNQVYDPDSVSQAHAIIKKLVEEQTISQQRIEQSYERILNLKAKRFGTSGSVQGSTKPLSFDDKTRACEYFKR